MCTEWHAWNKLLSAAPAVDSANAATPASQKAGPYPKTFTYDLVDIGPPRPPRAQSMPRFARILGIYHFICVGSSYYIRFSRINVK